MLQVKQEVYVNAYKCSSNIEKHKQYRIALKLILKFSIKFTQINSYQTPKNSLFVQADPTFFSSNVVVFTKKLSLKNNFIVTLQYFL